MVQDIADGFDFVDLGFVGSSYEGNDPWKVELHMTQGDSIEGAEGAMAAYPSHLAMEFEGKKKHQYVPFSLAAGANLSTRSDRSHVIQLEVVGFSENAPNFWPEELDWIGTDGLAPIYNAVGGFTLQMAPQGYHGSDEGIYPYLASAQSPIRFPNDAALDAFSGVLGHQHMPSPDSHWDPGLLDVSRILVACAWKLGQAPVPPSPVDPGPDPENPVTPTWYGDRMLSKQDPMLGGWDVVGCQQNLILQGHGFATTTDGWFGNDTEFSVVSFQRERGLQDDGVVGPKTACALGG